MIDFQKKMEEEYEKRVQDILTRVVGEGKVVAKVSLVRLRSRPDTRPSTTRKQRGQIAAERNHVWTALVLSTGAPGQIANAGPGRRPRCSNTQKYETTNYAVPEKVVRATSPWARSRRCRSRCWSMALQQRPGQARRSGRVLEVERREARQFKAIVAGPDLKRGDRSGDLEFRRDLENYDTAIAAYERRKMMNNLIQYAVIGIAIALFFFFVLRPFVKWLTTIPSEHGIVPAEDHRGSRGCRARTSSRSRMPYQSSSTRSTPKVEGEMIKEA